jgi:hypothetical protein
LLSDWVGDHVARRILERRLAAENGERKEERDDEGSHRELTPAWNNMNVSSTPEVAAQVLLAGSAPVVA